MKTTRVVLVVIDCSCCYILVKGLNLATNLVRVSQDMLQQNGGEVECVCMIHLSAIPGRQTPAHITPLRPDLYGMQARGPSVESIGRSVVRAQRAKSEHIPRCAATKTEPNERVRNSPTLHQTARAISDIVDSASHCPSVTS